MSVTTDAGNTGDERDSNGTPDTTSAPTRGGDDPAAGGGDDSAAGAAPRTLGVVEAVLYCDDLDAAEGFYTDVLGFEVFAREAGRHLFFRFDGTMFLVFNPEHTSTKATDVDGAPMALHGARGEGHVAFGTTHDDIDAWKQRLAAHGIAVESEVRWPAGGRSIYFRDPAGNSVELVTRDLWWPADDS